MASQTQTQQPQTQTQTKAAKSKKSKVVCNPPIVGHTLVEGPVLTAVSLEEPPKHTPSVQLHLKCFLCDLNPTDDQLAEEATNTCAAVPNRTSLQLTSIVETNSSPKTLGELISIQGQNLHHNVCHNRAYCFWCRSPFSGEPVGIPKHKMGDIYELDGNYCSPSCAAADLLNGHSSTKMERYHLLHHLYSPTKPIVTAPSPRYLLDIFGGMLTIEEYRAISSSGLQLVVTDKPVRRICPELHEFNAGFIIHGQSIRVAKGRVPAKKDKTIQEQFGLIAKSQ
jgi:hypothetical protein